MNIKRCFEILEISPDATYEEAKAAYRIMCQVWHPDKYNHSEQLHAKATSKIKEINAAWSQIEEFFKNEASREAESRASEERERSQRTEQERKQRTAENEENLSFDKTNKSKQDGNLIFYEAAIGVNFDKYARVAKEYDEHRNFPLSWHWPALLFGPFWCLYRKMYSLFGLLIVTEIALCRLTNIIWALGIWIIILSVFFPLVAKTFYAKYICKKIEFYSELDHTNKLIKLIAEGGTNAWVPYLAVIPLLGILIAITIPLFSDKAHTTNTDKAISQSIKSGIQYDIAPSILTNNEFLYKLFPNSDWVNIDYGDYISGAKSGYYFVDKNTIQHDANNNIYRFKSRVVSIRTSKDNIMYDVIRDQTLNCNISDINALNLYYRSSPSENYTYDNYTVDYENLPKKSPRSWTPDEITFATHYLCEHKPLPTH